jgi:hypothetical protein
MRGAFVRGAPLRGAALGSFLVCSGARLAWAQAAEPAAESATTPAATAAEPPSAAEVAAAPAPVAAPAPQSAIDVEVGGGMILYYYQPLEDPDGGTAKNFFEIFEARLRLDAVFGRYKVHITPRFRDTKERAFFPGEGWVEEAYAAGSIGPVTIKVGKVYAHLGKFWDNSWYGNAQQYDGLKLDLNHGLSIEGVWNEGQPFGLAYWAQYFIIDGTTSYAQPTRDTQSIPGAHRRNQLFGRIEPRLELGDTMGLDLGLGGSYAQADIPGLDEQNIVRFAADATFTVGGLAAWAEYSHQSGRHVTDFPAPGVSSDNNSYVMLGVEYTYDWLTARYNFNYGNYSEVDYSETRHIPGVAVKLDDHLTVLLEWAYGQGKLNGDTRLLDHSLDLTIHSNF